jgi:hypothetical protein
VEITMKTYYQIVQDKTFRELTNSQKEELQNRQTELALMWQAEQDELQKEILFDELLASLQGLVKSRAYREAEKSFTIDKEDFEGLIYLVLVETLVSYLEGQTELYGQKLMPFSQELDKPFQPIFLTNLNAVINMNYRHKGYDVHETTYHVTNRLDSPSPDDPTVTMGDALEVERSFELEVEHNLFVDQVVQDVFNGDEKKRTIVHMSVQEFKRNEIVSALKDEGQSSDAMAKQVNRTVKQFKAAYLKLT